MKESTNELKNFLNLLGGDSNKLQALLTNPKFLEVLNNPQLQNFLANSSK